jgi:hypothetical protein
MKVSAIDRVSTLAIIDPLSIASEVADSATTPVESARTVWEYELFVPTVRRTKEPDRPAQPVVYPGDKENDGPPSVTGRADRSTRAETNRPPPTKSADRRFMD